MIRNTIPQNLTLKALTALFLITLLVGLGALSAARAETPAPSPSQPAEQPAAQPTDHPIEQAASPTNTALARIKNQTLHAPENLIVGQPLQLEISVEHPPGTRITLPDKFEKTRWDLIDTTHSEVSTESATITTFALNFAIFRPGSARLPAFTLHVLASDGTRQELRTEEVSVFVRSAIDAAETPPFAPPRDPVAIWTSDYTLAWIGGFTLGGALLAALAVFAYRRRDRVFQDNKPVLPAHEVAFEKLRALERSSLLEQGEVMMYYVRMSEAVREYLGRRFDFPGTELTTAEINATLASMQSRWPRGIAQEDVRSWLEHCDFVKFSGSTPSKEAARKSLERAFGIVELTRRRSEIVIPTDSPEPDSDTQTPAAQTPAAKKATPSTDSETIENIEKTEKIEKPADSGKVEDLSDHDTSESLESSEKDNPEDQENPEDKEARK